MPKETIPTREPYVKVEDVGEIPVDQWLAENEPGSGGPVFQQGVEVVWNRTGYVQLGVKEMHPSTEQADSGYWTDLNRAQCNALIRFIRRARDQAFGKDE